MKIGMVFNGGGGKGAYQIGVMKVSYHLAWTDIYKPYLVLLSVR